MTSKHQPAQSHPSIIVFGVDENGKPKAARFVEKYAGLATKAAGHLKLQVLPITKGIAEIATKLPAGRVHANGSTFVPNVRRNLYSKLIAAVGDHESAQAASPSSSGSDQVKGSGDQLPDDWNGIAPGSLVVAQESQEDGWYEAIVVDQRADMLTLRWRDFPREKGVTRHRLSVALLYPAATNAAAPQQPGPQPADRKEVAPKTSKSKGDSKTDGAFPRTWEDIDIDALVLAKQDGPWGTWFEAIVSDRTGDELALRWRDYPTSQA